MSAATNKPMDPNQVAVVQQPTLQPLPPKLDLPRCTLCNKPFDTDYSKIQQAGHRLPVCCLNCSYGICFDCLQTDQKQSPSHHEIDWAECQHRDWLECRQCGERHIDAQNPLVNRTLCDMMILATQQHADNVLQQNQIRKLETANAALVLQLNQSRMEETATRNDERTKVFAQLAQASQPGTLAPEDLSEPPNGGVDETAIRNDERSKVHARLVQALPGILGKVLADIVSAQLAQALHGSLQNILANGDTTTNQDDDGDEGSVEPPTQPEAASMPVPQVTEPRKRDLPHSGTTSAHAGR